MFLTAQFACAAPSDTARQDVLARSSSGMTVTAKDLQAELKQASEADRKSLSGNPEALNQFIEAVLTRRILAREIEKAGGGKDPVVLSAIRVARDRVLSNLQLIRLDAKNTPDAKTLDKLARAIYDENPVIYSKPDRVRAHHILLPISDANSKQFAESLRSQLLSGASFEALAKTHSIDKRTASRGGDMGFFTLGQVPEVVADALKSLANPGDLSVPVESQFGYHILRLDERRDEGVPPYEEVSEQLIGQALRRILKDGRVKELEKLKQSMKLNNKAIEAFVRADVQ